MKFDSRFWTHDETPLLFITTLQSEVQRALDRAFTVHTITSTWLLRGIPALRMHPSRNRWQLDITQAPLHTFQNLRTFSCRSAQDARCVGHPHRCEHSNPVSWSRYESALPGIATASWGTCAADRCTPAAPCARVIAMLATVCSSESLYCTADGLVPITLNTSNIHSKLQKHRSYSVGISVKRAGIPMPREARRSPWALGIAGACSERTQAQTPDTTSRSGTIP